MAVQKNNVSFSFQNGIDSKTSGDVITAPVLSEIKDCVFTQGGVVKRRKGYSELPKEWVFSNGAGGGGTLAEGLSLNNANNNLMLFDSSSSYLFDEAYQKWFFIANNYGVKTQKKHIHSEETAYSGIDSFVFNNRYQITTWSNTKGAKFSIYDIENNEFIAQNLTISTNNIFSCQCIAFPNGNIILVYRDITTNFIGRRVFNINTLILGPEVNIYPLVSTSNLLFKLKVIPYNDTYGIIAIIQATDAALITRIDNVGNLLLATSYVIVPSIVGGFIANLNMQKDPAADRVYITYVDMNPDVSITVKGFVLNGLSIDIFSSIATIFTQPSGLLNPITRLAVSYKTSTEVMVFVSYYPLSGLYYPETNVYSVAPSSGVSVFKNKEINCLLFSDSFYSAVHGKVFFHAYIMTGRGLLGAYDPVDLLRNGISTLMNEDMLVSSRFSVGAAALVQNLHMPKVSAYNTGYLTATNSSFGSKGESISSLSHVFNFAYNSANIGGLTEFAQGCPQTFDGHKMFESSFNEVPVIINSSVANAGTGLSAGVYNYSYIFYHIDNSGNIHRSTPSIPLRVGGTGGLPAAPWHVTLPIKQLNITQRQNVFIRIYRTLANNSSAYYLVSSENLENNPNAAVVNFVDTLNDSAISGNETLYTIGGYLPNDPPPACSTIIAAKNRVMLISDEDQTVRYSKDKLTFYGVEYSDDFSLPQFNSVPQAIGQLDSNIILFNKSNVFAFSGNGPTDAGTQNTFTDIQLISTDTGTDNQSSVIRVPNGLLYKSEKGIYLLDRSLQTSYIGAPVERYNGYSVVSANNPPSTTEIRLAIFDNLQTPSRIILNYDYFYEQWGEFSTPSPSGNINAISSAVIDNNYYVLRPTGAVLKEMPYGTAPITFSDIPAPLIETGWIRVAGLQGFQRFRWIELFGTSLGINSISVIVYYDYNTNNISTTATLPINSAGRFQFRIKNRIQKLEAIKIRLQAFSPEEIVFSGMDFEIGVKSGLRRLSVTNTR